MKAQGTELYLIDPDDSSGCNILDVGCVLEINGIDTSIDQNETTCLRDSARTYEAGLATPGQASFTLQSNPADAVHVRMHQLKVAGTSLKWAVGWSDGTGVAPTECDSNGDFVLPTNRSWIIFDGFMNSFPFAFAQNTQVTSAVGIQVSGEPIWVPKTT